MRRTVLLAVVLLAGCGGAEPQPVAPARPAEPQQAELDWRESYPARGPRLLFHVADLVVGEESWSVTIAVTNGTGIGFDLGDDPADLGYGLMLFPDDDLEALEEAGRTGTLPPPRRATSIDPLPPDTLAPGETWSATLSAAGSLADGSWLRVTFGPLVAAGDPPEGMERIVYWITDRAHRL